ncbi:MAG: DNA repair protein RadA [Bacteriovoracaceae bacterium]|nr:DNA repair protein RadA [Bacteriovoracaceae bacterium]
MEKHIYTCQQCSYQSAQWRGRCPECGAWNSFQEEKQLSKKEQALWKSAQQNLAAEEAQAITKIGAEDYTRILAGVSEFDRVMGGGVIPGSLTLIGGGPGVGKSTLLGMILGAYVKNTAQKILYVSGEESLGQVAARTKRLGISHDNFYLLHATSWQKIEHELQRIKPSFVALDSIQTLYDEEVASLPGTISQIRAVAFQVMDYAKSHQVACFVIGHINKEGSLAGPKILEHMVDTVIYFEGDQKGGYRLLRSMKNRFGDTNEVGIFEMTDHGLAEIANPAQYFLDEFGEQAYGRSLACIMEGTRPIFLEVQALVVENKYGNGRRTTQGLDPNRLAMMVAVIEKYLGIPLGFNDIYLNVVGGMRLQERDSDLSVIASLLSSYFSVAWNHETIFLGEVGLTGEVRPVPLMGHRLKEMAQLNYKRAITSAKAANEWRGKFKNLEVIGIKNAAELKSLLTK